MAMTSEAATASVTLTAEAFAPISASRACTVPFLRIAHAEDNLVTLRSKGPSLDYCRPFRCR